MVANTATILPGTTVHDVNGADLGSVGRVWPYVPVSYAEGAPQPGQPLPEPGRVGYFSVDRTTILGIGIAHLYVPFSEVESVRTGGAIALQCAGEKCEEMYSEQPWFVDRDAV
ncbi:MAG: hypothetical protein ACRDFX_10185 [Chloroflexota bacterium]